MTQKVIFQYYLLTTLTRCAMNMISSTYVIFLLSKGLNLFEVNLVNVAFFVTLFLCEIPTGAFADVFGRKASFIVSCLTLSLGMFVYAFSESFWGFVFAEILGAIGSTFATGAFSSWLVDSLKHHEYNGSTSNIFARESQLKHGVGILAALAGAFLADISLSLPWIAGSVVYAITGVIAFIILKEEYFVREKFHPITGWYKLVDVVKTSAQYGIKNKNIRFVMLLVLGLNFAVMAPNMQWQPYFKEWIPNQKNLGFVWSGMALSLMFGSWLAPMLLKKIVSESKSLLICHAVTAMCLIGTVSFGNMTMTLIMFYMHEVARGAFEPIKEAYLHDNIPSKERATIVSFESIAHHAGGAVGLVISGALAEYGSIEFAWIVSGVSLLLVVLSLSRNNWR